MSNTGTGNAVQATITLKRPDGSLLALPGFSLPGGQNATLTANYTAPVIAQKGTAETDTAYLARLSAASGASQNLDAMLAWTDAAQSSYGPTDNPFTVTEQLPIVSVALTGPASVNLGDTITYSATLTNSGSAVAGVVNVVATLPDGSTRVVSVPSGTIVPGQSVPLSFGFPTGKTGLATATVAVTWQDAVQNIYGPVSASASVRVRRPLTVIATASPSTVIIPNPAVLSATATDDGMVNDILAYQWSKLSGPGNAVFANPSAASTSVSFDRPGTYALLITVSDSQGSTPVSASISVKAEQAISITASANPASTALGTSVTLTGAFSDDGITGDAASFQWSRISGPGNVTFTSPGQLNTSASFDQIGTYVLQLAASEGGQSAQATVSVAIISSSVPTFLNLAVSPAGINVVNGTETLTAVLTDQNHQPVANSLITFTVTGVDAGSSTVTTDSSGSAIFSYTGNSVGADQVRASVNTGVGPLVSNVLTVHWVKPFNPISTTSVHSLYFPSTTFDSFGQGFFGSAPLGPPIGFRDYPTLAFNADDGSATNSHAGLGGTTLPMFNYTVDLKDQWTGTIEEMDNNGNVYGNDYQVAYMGNFVVSAAGDYEIIVLSDDGFVLGMPGVGLKSGPTQPKISSTGVKGYPVLAGFNRVSNGIYKIILSFPAPGVYPYEFDYFTDPFFSQFIVGLPAALPHGFRVLPPAVNLAITPNVATTRHLGGNQRIRVATSDITGNPAVGTAIRLTITGANPQELVGNTDSNGVAFFTYPGLNAGNDRIQATGAINEINAISNELVLFWTNNNVPNQPPAVDAGADQIIDLPATATLKGSVTDDGLPIGSTLSMQWSKVSGPGNVTFNNATAEVAQAAFDQPGSYVLQLSASDTQFTSSAMVKVLAIPQNAVAAKLKASFNANPAVVGGPATIQALAADRACDPISGVTVRFAVSGTNNQSGTAVTDIHGQASFSYSSSQNGTDTVTLTASTAAGNLSDSVTVYWVTPVMPFATSSLHAQYFAGGLNAVFSAVPGQTVLATRDFPNIGFNGPDAFTLGGNAGVNFSTFPDTDLAVDNIGRFIGTVEQRDAEGNPLGANVQAVYSGSFVVAAPGDYTVRIDSGGGYFFGIGNGAFLIGWDTLPFNTPDVTPFFGYPVTWGFNGFDSFLPVSLTIHFPAAGSYPYEFDFTLSRPGLYILTGNSLNFRGINIMPTAGSVALTPLQPMQIAPGQTVSGQVQVTDASGAAAASTPVTITVMGVNAQQLSATTDKSGIASFSYSGTTPGDDRVQASASTSGLAIWSNELRVHWTSATAPPVVSAGTSQVFPQTGLLPLNGSVTDSLPFTSQWTLLSGPGPVSFSNAAAPASSVTITTPGVYLFQLSVNDGQFKASAQVTYTVGNQPPVVSVAPAGPVQTKVPLTLNGSVTDDGLPNRTLTIQWSQVSGPTGGTAFFTSTTSAVTQVSFDQTGTYVLALSANDSLATTTATISVAVLPPPPVPPQVSFDLPDGADITKPVAIHGSVTTGTYELAYARGGQDDSNLQYTAFAHGSAPVTNGLLGTFDPTVLFNGGYVIRLLSTDASGQTSSTTATVTVSRNMKVGIFTLSFNDLSVPLPGLPLILTRTYDSRNKDLGDFGVGWNLSLSNVRVEKSHTFGKGWFESVSLSNGFSQFCLEPNGPRSVTFTFADGRIYKFQTVSGPECQMFEPIAVPQINFSQVSTGSSTSGATLHLNIILRREIAGALFMMQ